MDGLDNEIIETNLPTEPEVKAPEINLGEPDLSKFIDEDEPEITAGDVMPSNAKAKKVLKPSYAIKKLMPTLFSVIARVKGDHWLLEEEEVDDFAEAFDDCIEHYYPDMNGLPPWAMLAFSSGMIVLPRLMIDGMSDKEKEVLQQVQAEEEQKQVGFNTVLRPQEG